MARFDMFPGLPSPGIVVVAGSRTIMASDNNKTLLCTAAVTLTVPLGLGYMLFRVRQATAGKATIAVIFGLNIIAPFGAATGGNMGESLIIESDGATVWVE